MKVITVLFNLALAATAMAGAVDTRALEPGFAERACGTTGAPCTSGDDCCTYCDPYSGWTCTDSTRACVEKGTVPALGQNDCCSYKVDADGKCT
ncbi:hypothetical protein GCG54_00007664 [Colletotrichum gloeosporioides]|uniref:Uncharacterized protein n=1 Tax=Colletotrichum gloeosporioides TaxID=474922 RepID=A0A8H4CPT2_COLGL|nr:uncharacterized protein GCG54_00007664 [Colletotrichum gloeosporioides]KAF3807928.1 hypothetical protein GCG54_00007664 [Colletotrichum gloeosporioides]